MMLQSSREAQDIIREQRECVEELKNSFSLEALERYMQTLERYGEILQRNSDAVEGILEALERLAHSAPTGTKLGFTLRHQNYN